MAGYQYDECPTTSTEAVFQIELQRRGGADGDGGGVNTETSDVIMRNAVRPASNGSYDIAPIAGRKSRRKVSAPRIDEIQGSESPDVSDGADVFTEEPVLNCPLHQETSTEGIRGLSGFVCEGRLYCFLDEMGSKGGTVVTSAIFIKKAVQQAFANTAKYHYANLSNTNQYQIRKMACQTLVDVALMMANISQLRTLLSLGESLVQYYNILLTLVCFSLACQVAFGVLMFVIWVRESDQHQKDDFLKNLKELEESKSIPITTTERARRSMLKRQEDFDHKLVTGRFNYFTMVLVFFITITNMFITGFGIKTLNLDNGENRENPS